MKIYEIDKGNNNFIFKELLYQPQIKLLYPNLLKRKIVKLDLENSDYHFPKKYYKTERAQVIQKLYEGRMQVYFNLTHEPLLLGHYDCEECNIIRPVMWSVIKEIYYEINRDAEYYKKFKDIFVRSDFSLSKFQDYPDRICYISMKLRLHFLSTDLFKHLELVIQPKKELE